MKKTKIKIQSKKNIPAKILYFHTAVPKNWPSGTNNKIELNPGPKVIPNELTATKIEEYLLYAHTSTFIAKNFLVINLAPPIPKIILPIIKDINPPIDAYDSYFIVSDM